MEVCTEWTRFVRLGLRKSVFDNNHCSYFVFMSLKCEKKNDGELFTFEPFQYTPHTVHCKVLSQNMNKTFHICHGFRKKPKAPASRIQMATAKQRHYPTPFLRS